MPNAEVVLLDTRRFAIETQGPVIAQTMLALLGRHLSR